jgi:hypothetical protein
MRSIKNEYIGLFTSAYTKILNRIEMAYVLNGYPFWPAFGQVENSLRKPVQDHRIPVPRITSEVRRLI